MSYLTSILGLLATCVAIRGDTWDGKASTWRRLTEVGWAALVIALVACGLEIYKVHAEHALRESRRLAAEQLIKNITSEVWLRFALVRVNSNDSAEPAQDALNARAKKLGNELGRIAYEYDQALDVYKEVLKTSENDAILQVSKAMRQPPSLGNRGAWDAYIDLLDDDRKKLASIFCHGTPKVETACSQNAGLDLSTFMDQILPRAPGASK